MCSISQYGSEIFGYEKYESAFKLHLRAARAFLGLPKNVASFGLISELDWLLPQFQSQIRMIQHFGRIMCTSSDRLLYRIYVWDRKLAESGQIVTWSSEVQSILSQHNLAKIFDDQQIFQSKEIATKLKTSMYELQQQIVRNECQNKPKLRTFMLFKDFGPLPPHVGKPLSFVERKSISKLRLGILPLRIETARYIRPILPENQRLCYCDSGEIESEYHAIFICSKYSNLRDAWLKKICIPPNFHELEMSEKFSFILNKPENVRLTSQYIVSFMDLRCLINKAY